jgi:hypothetical protein
MRADDVATIESADVHFAPPPTHGAARASPQADPRGSQLAGAILVLPLTEHLASTRGAQRAREGGKRSAASRPRAAASPRTRGGDVVPLSASSPSPLAPPAFAPPRHPRALSPQRQNSVFCAAQPRASPRGRVSCVWVAASPPLSPRPRPTQTRTPAPAGARPPCAPPPPDCRMVLVYGERMATGFVASLGRHRSVGWGDGTGARAAAP